MMPVVGNHDTVTNCILDRPPGIDREERTVI
jgi:hypothetical protein